MKTLYLATILSATLALSACFGGGDDIEVAPSETTYSTTMGQELMDLQAAYDQQLMTEEQYESAKEKIMARHDDE